MTDFSKVQGFVSQNRQERLETFLVTIVQDEKSEYLQRRSIRLLLIVLRQLSYLFKSIVTLRLYLYEKRLLRHHTLGCQVISVGNLTVGGTGKTPVVEAFARELAREGRKVAILSRGYKKVEPTFGQKVMDKLTFAERRRPPRVVSDGKELLLDSAMSGDEPYMLAMNLPEVCVLVDRDRVKSGRYAVTKMGCDTLILDDGFQYLSLKHQVEIVLVDKRNPFGNGHVLPRGLLREPIKNIKRANFIFITKSDGQGLEPLRKQLNELNPEAEVIECCHEARYLQNIYNADRVPLETLKGARVGVISGIAVPEGFEDSVAARGAELVFKVRYADHHRYSQQEIIELINEASSKNVDMIITTEKDAVRFPRMGRRDVPIFFLRVDIELLRGEQDFHDCIQRICFKKSS